MKLKKIGIVVAVSLGLVLCACGTKYIDKDKLDKSVSEMTDEDNADNAKIAYDVLSSIKDEADDLFEKAKDLAKEDVDTKTHIEKTDEWNEELKKSVFVIDHMHTPTDAISAAADNVRAYVCGIQAVNNIADQGKDAEIQETTDEGVMADATLKLLKESY